MLTRRAVLAGALSVGVLRGQVNFAVPAHACDCHTHIFGDPAQFPLSPKRAYTPETASPQEMAALHRALHVERVVIVTPSVYGTDNSATLYGMKARGRTARGVAVIDEHTPEAELDAMGKAGVCGVRLNLATAGVNDPAIARQRFEAMAQRLKQRGWHVQIFTNLPVIAAIKDAVLASPVPVVFDHFGGAQAALGVTQPGFADLLALLRSGKAYVKVSGAYITSSHEPDFADAGPLAKSLIAANPDRVLWGTDWPHPDTRALSRRAPLQVTPLRKIDDERLLNQFARWAPEPRIRQKILVENPARLYGFNS